MNLPLIMQPIYCILHPFYSSNQFVSRYITLYIHLTFMLIKTNRLWFLIADVRLEIFLCIYLVGAVSCYNAIERDSKCKLYKFPWYLLKVWMKSSIRLRNFTPNIFLSVSIFQVVKFAVSGFVVSKYENISTRISLSLPVLMRFYLYCNFVF